ncbi:MAG: hypothetical protein P8L17_01035 [Methylophilaceae bacterium]|nr:hypothetical protein [Methylophilaceae bacterium]
MADKQAKAIMINDKQYSEDQLNDQQKVMINHVQDLERKIRSAQFSLDQMTVGREAFVKMLAGSLEEDTAKVN